MIDVTDDTDTSRFEVSVRDYEHITVEAENEEEAREKAVEQSKFRHGEAYQCVELDG